jgi:hypothetical protein
LLLFDDATWQHRFRRMSPSNPGPDAFELWKRTLEEGTQAWLRALGQTAGSPTAGPPASPANPPPPVDFSQFWRPILGQGMEMWQKMATPQGSVDPDFARQWKGFLDQWIEAWSKGLAQAMGSEAFAQALGRYLDQTLVATAPLKKAVDQQTDAGLRALGLPSRSQVVGLASQLVALEERIEGLEDRLDALKGMLSDVRRALDDERARAAQAPTRGTEKAPKGPRATTKETKDR